MTNFNLRDEVLYMGKRGMVTFVDELYIVVTLPASPGRDYPRCVVFPEYQHQVKHIRN